MFLVTNENLGEKKSLHFKNSYQRKVGCKHSHRKTNHHCVFGTLVRTPLPPSRPWWDQQFALDWVGGST